MKGDSPHVKKEAGTPTNQPTHRKGSTAKTRSARRTGGRRRWAGTVTAAQSRVELWKWAHSSGSLSLPCRQGKPTASVSPNRRRRGLCCLPHPATPCSSRSYPHPPASLALQESDHHRAAPPPRVNWRVIECRREASIPEQSSSRRRRRR